MWSPRSAGALARTVTALVALLLLPLPALAVTVERVTSPGGIEAWLVQDHSNPIIAMELAFKGGAALDPAAKPGLASMTAALLDEGAGPLDSQAFQQKLEDLVITLHFDAGLDSFRGHVKTLTTNRDTAFDLLRLALTQPRFDKEPVERIRGQIIGGLMRESQSPNAVAARQWFKTMFPGHPYGRSARGEIETIKTIQKPDMKALVREQLTRDRLVVGVVGDITPAELARLLDASFSALPASGTVSPVAETSASRGGGVSVIPRDNPQTVAVFGAPGIKRDDPDWYAASVMNYILGGGGFASRLTEEVREKRGLAYSVYSYLSPLRHAGLIVGGVATENSRFKESLDLIKAEFRRMRETGPTETELANAKTYLNGSFPLQLDSTEAVAGLLVQMQMDQLPPDFLDRRAALIEAVGMDDVKRAAARLLDPETLTFVVVGKPAGF
ncbi:zinc protease [Paramagnetospirillum marisnigri]|uniref:Zinc protease n=1 Tax=Paramagnetospirillum marisnigri TaxID=1285242 RepID=A0A178MS92_9PROT|nr:pitrilysin family protein [Paramagnetospirillum marisnigri]OAN52369.1 zinc protease [Paramagnetospirillum marisnigri]